MSDAFSSLARSHAGDVRTAPFPDPPALPLGSLHVREARLKPLSADALRRVAEVMGLPFDPDDGDVRADGP